MAGWSAGRIALAVIGVFVVAFAIRLAMPGDVDVGPGDVSIEASRKFQAGIYDKLGHDFANLYGLHIHHRYYVRGDESLEEASENLGHQLMKNIPREFFTSKPIIRVLDVGCGIGGPAQHMARMFPNVHVTGINISPHQVQTANELAETNGVSDRVKFFTMDAERLNETVVPDDYFDYIYGSEVIGYFQDRKAWFKAAARKLKRGGYYSVAEIGRAPGMSDDPSASAQPALLAKLREEAAAKGVTLPAAQPAARTGTSVELARSAERNWRIAVPFSTMDEMIGFAGAAGLRVLSAENATENIMGTYDDPLWVVFTVSFWKLLWSFGSQFFEYLTAMNAFKAAHAGDALRYGIICFQKL
jgi:ubiquinone/menaquinone biosynthesis C-methylase UbiE